jgi:hypothetical protein
MKIINQLFIILAAAFLDICLNGLMGRLISVTTSFVFAYHVSFFSPRILMIVSAFFVVMQALLYGVTTPFFYCMLIVMLWSAKYFNKLLREERWVRWLLTFAYFIILALFMLAR